MKKFNLQDKQISLVAKHLESFENDALTEVAEAYVGGIGLVAGHSKVRCGKDYAYDRSAQ